MRFFTFGLAELYWLVESMDEHVLEISDNRSFGTTRAEFLTLVKRVCHQLEVKLTDDGLGDRLYRQDINKHGHSKACVTTELRRVLTHTTTVW